MRQQTSQQKNQLSICVRYLTDNFEVEEAFLGFVDLPSKLHLVDETVVAKIEQSLGDELSNNAAFGQEVKKLTPLLTSLSRQFQN